MSECHLVLQIRETEVFYKIPPDCLLLAVTLKLCGCVTTVDDGLLMNDVVHSVCHVREQLHICL